MGHFYKMLRGEGKDKQDAIRNGTETFLREEGNRHNVRGTDKTRLVERIPPLGVTIVTPEGGTTYDYTRRNFKAPQSEWLEVWEFELHTHA